MGWQQPCYRVVSGRVGPTGGGIHRGRGEVITALQGYLVCYQYTAVSYDPVIVGVLAVEGA